MCKITTVNLWLFYWTDSLDCTARLASIILSLKIISKITFVVKVTN